MLRLRLSDGVAFDDYAAQWGRDAREVYSDELNRLAKLRLLDVDARRFALSDGGLAVADAIASEFLRV
jgi:coproporphyrinogen III oxidase-like Fe-S oxidoreductase